MKGTRTTLIAVALLLALATPPLSASPGRLAALGLGYSTSWMVDVDEGFFFLNPAVLEQLRPQVWGDLWNAQAGVLVNPGGNFDLYLITGMPVDTASFGGIPGSPITPLARELLRAGVAFAAGGIDIGISAFTGGTAYTDAANNDQDLVAGAIGGVVLPLSTSVSLDAAGGVTYWSIQRHFTPAADYVATPLDVSLAGRLNFLSQANTFHVYGQFGYANRGYTLAGTATADTTSSLTAGVSDDLRPAPSVLVFAGSYVAATFNSVPAASTNTFLVNGNVGTEISLGTAAVARLGIQRVFSTIQYTSAANSTSTSDGPTTISGGFGLNLGDLTFDAQVSTGLILQGPNFISGASNNWMAALSATYYLGKAAK